MKKAVPIAVILAAALLGFGAATSQPSQKEKTYGDAVVAEVTSIYDGDTFRCNIKGYPPIIGERIAIRIYGIDCPELRDNRSDVKVLARQAKQFTVSKLRAAKVVRLRSLRRDKYFRILAEVEVDGQDLGKLLLEEGLAKPYDGGKKPKWGK